MMFFDCPAYLDENGTQRCGLPAEVNDRFTSGSTSGPIENVKICCPSGHRFHGPIEFLTMSAERAIEQAAAGPGCRPLTPGPAPASSRPGPHQCGRSV